MEFKAEGVIPATLVAFETDFEIDIAASRKHLRDVAMLRALVRSRSMAMRRKFTRSALPNSSSFWPNRLTRLGMRCRW